MIQILLSVYLFILPLICSYPLNLCNTSFVFPNTLVCFLSLLHPNSLTIIHTNYFSSGAWFMLDEMISQDDMITQALYCDRLDGPFKPKLRSRWHCPSPALLLWYSNPYYPRTFAMVQKIGYGPNQGVSPWDWRWGHRTIWKTTEMMQSGGDEWQWYWYIVIIC